MLYMADLKLLLTNCFGDFRIPNIHARVTKIATKIN